MEIRRCFIILLFLSLAGCATQTHIPIETKYEIVKKDSTVFNIKDSVVIVPVERIIDIVPVYDTLRLETTLAKSEAYIDTTLHLLRGKIENKKQFAQHTHKEEKETVKTDNAYVEKPVPYEVVVEKPYIPKFYKFTLYWFIATVILLILGIYLKFKP